MRRSVTTLGMVVAVSVALTVQAAVNLLETDAAAAFKAGDYERAAQEFAVLVSENPEDVTLLRYLGITLRKLGRYEDSLTILQKALGIAPKNVALHYHAAVTIYRAGAEEAAVESFKTVTTLEPASKYAELAREYLAAIAEQLVQGQKASEPQRFGFYGQLGWTYDSNLLASPDDSGLSSSDTGANRYTAYLSGEYFLLRDERWTATVDLSTYGAGYAENRFNDSDVLQLNPGVSIQRAGQLGRFPAVYSLRYDYLDVELDGEPYSESSAATAMARVSFSPRTATRLSYRYTDDDFQNQGFDPAFSSRDADNHAVTLTNTWYLMERRVELDVGAGYTRNNADGLNFNYDAWEGTAALRFILPREWRLDFRASYAVDDYPDFAGPVNRETDITIVDITLRRWFRNGFLVELNVAWHDEESSYDLLTFDRYSAGLRFSYAY